MRNRIARRLRPAPRPPAGLRYSLVVVRYDGAEEAADHEYADLDAAETALSLLAMGTRLHNLGEMENPVVAVKLVDRVSNETVTVLDIDPPDVLVG